MKKTLKGILIGGVAGFIFSIILMIFVPFENIFHKPIEMLIYFVCHNSIRCSNPVKFALFRMISTAIFYIILFSIIGLVISKCLDKRY